MLLLESEVQTTSSNLDFKRFLDYKLEAQADVSTTFS